MRGHCNQNLERVVVALRRGGRWRLGGLGETATESLKGLDQEAIGKGLVESTKNITIHWRKGDLLCGGVKCSL